MCTHAQSYFLETHKAVPHQTGLKLGMGRTIIVTFQSTGVFLITMYTNLSYQQSGDVVQPTPGWWKARHAEIQ